MDQSSLLDYVKVVKNEMDAAELMQYCLRDWYLIEEPDEKTEAMGDLRFKIRLSSKSLQIFLDIIS